MVSINIAGGQGITQAIASKLGLSKDACKKIGLAKWQAVMNEVQNAKPASTNQNTANNSSETSIFRKGKNYTADVNKLGDKTTFHTNFVVDKGSVEIDDGAWNKIVQILTGKTPDVQTTVQEETHPIEEQPQPTPDETPDVQPKERLIAGKVIKRSVDGEKQDIAVIKQNGQKTRREVNSDGTLGDTLAATKTFGKNKYISGDFPPETRILEREVNGKKSQIGIYEDENGNKVRKQVITDEETGKQTLGENLVAISTAGKNKYITQSKFDEQVRTVLGLSADDEIPSDLKPEYITISGQECLVFKKDGRVMDSKSIREYMNNYKKPATPQVPENPTPETPVTGLGTSAAPVEVTPSPTVITAPSPKENPNSGENIGDDLTPQTVLQAQFTPLSSAPKAGLSPDEDPQYDAIVRGGTVDVDTSEKVESSHDNTVRGTNVENVEPKNYKIGNVEFSENGYRMTSNSNVEGENEAVQQFILNSSNIKQENNGQFNIRGHKGRLSTAQARAELSMRTLVRQKDTYVELSNKDPKDLKPSEKTFLDNFNAKLAQMELKLDNEGNFQNI